MKKTIFLALAFVASNLLAQQKSDSIGLIQSSNIYATALGDISYLSLNFEKRYVINSYIFATGKIGLGLTKEFHLHFNFWGSGSNYNYPDQYYLTLPHHVSLNFGYRRSFFEIGMGGVFVPLSSYSYYEAYYLYPFVGYRYQPLHFNKLLFRIFVSYPLKGVFGDNFIFIPVGLSLGWVL